MPHPLKGKDMKTHKDKSTVDHRVQTGGSGTFKYITSNISDNIDRDPNSKQNPNKLLQK